jgi:ATP-dependent phosphofructokinase / diphosphate-dependent phosphofructokinase
VDVRSTRYAIARRYMIRLRRDDFQDPHELAKLAATCGFSPEKFRGEFAYLVEDEPPALVLDDVPAEAPGPAPAPAARPPRRRRRR